MRARLNTRIDADGQTLANRDTIRIEGLPAPGPDTWRWCARQTGRGSGRARSSCQSRTWRSRAELALRRQRPRRRGAYRRRGPRGDRGRRARGAQVYTAATRGREKNTFHVVTGPPDPAQPTRAEREAYADGAAQQAAELRRQGDGRRGPGRYAADAGPAQRPAARPVGGSARPGLQQDEPERTALEEIQAAQDSPLTPATCCTLGRRSGIWMSVPQIDQAGPAADRRAGAFARYLTGPGAACPAAGAPRARDRRPPDRGPRSTPSPPAPLTGLRSIAAGLHGRLGKEPPPARGETRTWAERAPPDAPEPDPGGRPDTRHARQAELGRQLAERPPHVGTGGVGRPARPGSGRCARTGSAGRPSWSPTGRRPGSPTRRRRSARCPRASRSCGRPSTPLCAALQLPDDQALLRAMGRGELEAEGRRARPGHSGRAARCPAEIDERESDWKTPRFALTQPGLPWTPRRQRRRRASAGRRSRPSPARRGRRGPPGVDGGPRHRGGPAEAAERELRERGVAERIPAPPGADHWPMTDAEFDVYLDQLVAGTRQEASARAEAEAERGQAQLEAEPKPEPYQAMSDAEFGQYLDRLVAEAEGREWVPPEPGAEPEPQPGPLPEAEFQETVGRIVAESEGREYVPPGARPEPEPEPRTEPLSDAEFWAQLGRAVAEAEGREYMPEPDQPEPEAGSEAEPLSDAALREELDRIVAESEGRDTYHRRQSPNRSHGRSLCRRRSSGRSLTGSSATHSAAGNRNRNPKSSGRSLRRTGCCSTGPTTPRCSGRSATCRTWPGSTRTSSTSAGR